MLHLSARSLPIALFAAALLSAVAVPAVAQDPAADSAPDTPVQTVTPDPKDHGDAKGGEKDSKDSGWKDDDKEGKKDDGKDQEDKGQDQKGYDDKGYGDKGYDDKGYDDKGYGDKGYGDKGYGDKDRGYGRDEDKKNDHGRDDRKGHDGRKHDRDGKRDYRKHDRDKLDYKLRLGHRGRSKGKHHVSFSEAVGRLSVHSWNVRHQGWARDKGKGFTVVTFKHSRRHRDDTKFEVFKVHEGKVRTSFKRDGRFDKITVTVCKVTPAHHRKVVHVCKTRIFSKGWH